MAEDYRGGTRIFFQPAKRDEACHEEKEKTKNKTGILIVWIYQTGLTGGRGEEGEVTCLTARPA